MTKAFLLLFIILAPSFVFAQSVFINEIAWMGSMVEGVDPKQNWRYEWLELFNTKESPLQIEGWNIELYRGEELYFQIPLGGTVPAQGYFLVGASDKISAVDVNYANLGGKFLNSGMKVVLKDDLSNVVDEVDARGSWPAGDNKTKQTIERIAQAWQTSKEPGGTPKTQNSSGVAAKLMAQKLSFPGKLSFNAPTTENLTELSFGKTKKDPEGSPRLEGRGSLAAFSIAFPAALLAGVLALAARRFLYPEQSRRVG